MRKISIIIIIITVILIMIGACGCTNIKRETLEDKMVRYMNEKYTEDEFFYKAPFGGGSGAVYKKIIVTSAQYPDKKIYVLYSNQDGKEIYSDNYLGVKYELEVEEQIKKALDKVFDAEYQLYYSADSSACPNDEGTLSLEEYLSSKEAYIGFNVIVNTVVSDEEKIQKELENSITEMGICCTGTIYFVDSSNYISDLASEDVGAFLYKGLYDKALTIEMESSESFSNVTWE